MFDFSGHFSTNTLNSDIPKFASNNLAQPARLYKIRAGQVASATFGTYAINPDGSVTFHYIGASFPSLIGTDQKRMIVISGDQMKYTNPPPPPPQGLGWRDGGTHVFTRAK